MKLAYAGGAPFAAQVLERVLSGDHEIVVCLTTPDRPRGRHGRPQPSALKEAALRLGVPLLQPASLAAPRAQNELLGHAPDVLVACAYGVIVPASLLERIEALVVHPSPVPRWRGAAPVERALMAGETRLGVATLRMTAGVDEGPVADAREVVVPRDADAGEAYALLAGPAAGSLLSVLAAIENGSVVWRPQRGTPCYAAKLTDADRRIDWSRPASELADQVRALSPRIGAVTELGGRRVLVWKARPLAEPPADVSRDRLVLACGQGHLEILELQEAGRRRMDVRAYLRGAGRHLTQA